MNLMPCAALLAAFALILTWPASSAEERKVEISNAHTDAIVLVTATSLDASGETLKFVTRIDPGKSHWVDFNNGTGSCTFSIHAEFANGGRAVVSPVDVCDEYWVVFE